MASLGDSMQIKPLNQNIAPPQSLTSLTTKGLTYGVLCNFPVTGGVPIKVKGPENTHRKQVFAVHLMLEEGHMARQ